MYSPVPVPVTVPPPTEIQSVPVTVEDSTWPDVPGELVESYIAPVILALPEICSFSEGAVVPTPALDPETV